MDNASQLAVTTSDQIKKELAVVDSTRASGSSEVLTNLESQARHLVERLVEMKPEDLEAREAEKRKVENVGLEHQMKAARQSQLLKQPLKDLTRRGEDGGPVAQALTNLKMQVEELDPVKIDGSAGWFSRLMGALPMVGSPMKRYFTKFESAQTVIAAIMKSLEQGRDQLKRDNVTLSEDQRQMQEMSINLTQDVKLGELIDQQLQYKLERELTGDDAKRKFIQEDVMFPLRQRVMDLQTQLVVQQQGILATEIIIRNNKELIRGVDRSLTVTISALNVAVAVAMALENQKIVLDKVNAVSQTTSNLILNTSQRLKNQGVEIHKQAASSQLNLESLKSAFTDIKTAMDDISRFRQEALPHMAEQILELDKLSEAGAGEIKKLEEARKSGSLPI